MDGPVRVRTARAQRRRTQAGGWRGAGPGTGLHRPVPGHRGLSAPATAARGTRRAVRRDPPHRHPRHPRDPPAARRPRLRRPRPTWRPPAHPGPCGAITSDSRRATRRRCSLPRQRPEHITYELRQLTTEPLHIPQLHTQKMPPQEEKSPKVTKCYQGGGVVLAQQRADRAWSERAGRSRSRSSPDPPPHPERCVRAPVGLLQDSANPPTSAVPGCHRFHSRASTSWSRPQVGRALLLRRASNSLWQAAEDLQSDRYGGE
ncbi:hypothetical protein FB465_6468 [Kitasatospora atroaurantiaca]|uniref:Uncharacterized protein n=1 Tax=Kitasatospora atroaurantiaca TaxID=285545 RepID=A0A561F0A9_9ACTN|nr:hypothetical protein FB465_6468 [Kitasatospora atroaurantiaca]